MIDDSQNLEALFGHIRRIADVLGAEPSATQEAGSAEGRSGPVLARVVAAFGLSEFERDVLILAAGYELDTEVRSWCASAVGGPPTMALALDRLPRGHWSATSPHAPLRRWHLVELDGSGGPLHAPMRIAERVLHALLGVSGVDAEFGAVVEPVPPFGSLGVATEAALEVAARHWAEPAGGHPPPVLHLEGPPEVGAAAAAALGAAAGSPVVRLLASDIPTEPTVLTRWARLLEREVALGGPALVVVDDEPHPAAARAAERLLEQVQGPILLAGRRRWAIGARAMASVEVAAPTVDERKAAWSAAIAEWHGSGDRWTDTVLEPTDVELADLAHDFPLTGSALLDAAAEARQTAACGVPMQVALRHAARRRARSGLDGLAQRLDSTVGWADLTLPAEQRAALHEMAAHVRSRRIVHDEWRFGRRGGRGLGVTALFSGPSGTGKTLAAEVLAGELGLDLYRIDLSATVSKYIGETEKNLRVLFDRAEDSSAILLFDEADALFGKRSEVHDAHDRHANVEVSYLLQRMEAYRGLAILTTNFPENLDGAFLRRLRYVVTFPYPEPAARADLWRHAFPAEAPVSALDVDVLARLDLTGGHIQNIALGAAVLAADAGSPVTMGLVQRAARTEYAKLARSLTPAETAGWTLEEVR